MCVCYDQVMDVKLNRNVDRNETVDGWTDRYTIAIIIKLFVTQNNLRVFKDYYLLYS